MISEGFWIGETSSQTTNVLDPVAFPAFVEVDLFAPQGDWTLQLSLCQPVRSGIPEPLPGAAWGESLPNWSYLWANRLHVWDSKEGK